MLTIVKNSFIKKVNDDFDSNKILGVYANTKDVVLAFMNHPFSVPKGSNNLPGFAPYEFIDLAGPRVQSNIKTIEPDWLFMDWDKGYTIEQFQEDFKDYEYYLYTSSSHSVNFHKFRVLLRVKQLEFDFNNVIHRRIYKELGMQLFPHCDPAMFVLPQIMYVPNKLNDDYRCVTNPNGKPFEIPQQKFDDMVFQFKLDKQKLEVEKLVNTTLIKTKTSNTLPYDERQHADNIFKRYCKSQIAPGNNYSVAVSFFSYCGKVKTISWDTAWMIAQQYLPVKRNEESNYKNLFNSAIF